MGASWVPPAWVVLRVADSVTLASIVKELAFRGYVMRRPIVLDFDRVPLTRWTPLAVPGASLLFGTLHERWWLASLAELAYALAVLRRGRLLDGIIAHATTNRIVAAYALTTGNWALWL